FPLENASGSVRHLTRPNTSTLAFLSALKKPPNTFSPRGDAHPAKSPTNESVTRNVPSPFENATGSVFQPATPVSAMSLLKSPSKSPTSFFSRVTGASLPSGTHGEEHSGGYGVLIPASLIHVNITLLPPHRVQKLLGSK